VQDGGAGGVIGLASLPTSQTYCFSDRRKELRHATALHGLLPEALQYLLPTKADWLEEFGMVLRCDRQGRFAVRHPAAIQVRGTSEHTPEAS
jgi:hypothetical protein